MTAPLRLVVVWLAGALALAVAWRADAWRQCAPAAAPALAAAPTSAPLASADEARAAIAKHLRGRYEGTRLEHRAPLIEVRDETLQRLLPNTRFFVTSLGIGGFDFTPVGELISFKRTSSGDDIRCARDDEFFLEQFNGIALPDVRAPQEIAFAAARLLATMVGGGVVRFAVHETRAEIWMGDVLWFSLDVVVYHGRVSRIELAMR